VFEKVYFILISYQRHYILTFSNKSYLILLARAFSILFTLTVALSVLTRTHKSVYYPYCIPIHFAQCSAFPTQSLEQIAEAHSPDL